jgi:hypothetical protein
MNYTYFYTLTFLLFILSALWFFSLFYYISRLSYNPLFLSLSGLFAHFGRHLGQRGRDCLRLPDVGFWVDDCRPHLLHLHRAPHRHQRLGSHLRCGEDSNAEATGTIGSRTARSVQQGQKSLCHKTSCKCSCPGAK